MGKGRNCRGDSEERGAEQSKGLLLFLCAAGERKTPVFGLTKILGDCMKGELLLLLLLSVTALGHPQTSPVLPGEENLISGLPWRSLVALDGRSSIVK